MHNTSCGAKRRSGNESAPWSRRSPKVSMTTADGPALPSSPPELLEAADLVIEMTLVKHHLAPGVKAQQGIEP